MKKHLARVLLLAVILALLPSINTAGALTYDEIVKGQSGKVLGETTAPTNLLPVAGAQLNPTTTSVQLSWNPVSGTGAYAIRVVDNTDSAVRDSRNNCGINQYYVCVDGFTQPSFSITVVPGHSYTWWVHAIANGVWSTHSASHFAVEITGEVINTLDFFLTKNLSQGLTGSHPLSQTINGQTAYYVKWDNSSFEIYKWDNDYIYLVEDHSGSPGLPYTFSEGKWLKRSMRVGESIQNLNNQIQHYSSSCGLGTKASFPYTVTLESHLPSYDLGGDLGTQDVIVVKYNYSNSVGQQIYEKSYYSKQYGWVKWELYNVNETVAHTSIFNKLGGSPIIPGVSCSGIVLNPQPAPTPLPTPSPTPLPPTPVPSPSPTPTPTPTPSPIPPPEQDTDWYPSSSLVNENGTIHFICGSSYVPFTNWQAFAGLGYSLKNVVNGQLFRYTPATSYFITSANDAHPWCSWLSVGGTIYYSHESGLIGVPSWDVFVSNGGESKFIIKANKYDTAILNANKNLPVLQLNDQRVYR